VRGVLALGRGAVRERHRTAAPHPDALVERYARRTTGTIRLNLFDLKPRTFQSCASAGNIETEEESILDDTCEDPQTQVNNRHPCNARLRSRLFRNFYQAVGD